MSGSPKPASPGRARARGPLLGVKDGTAYALLYGGETTLTRAALKAIRDAIKRADPIFDGSLVVYGEQSRLMPDTLGREKITFKQMPYDIKMRG